IYQPLADGGWMSVHEDVTDQRKAEAQIVHMTTHDALTDMPSRTLFRDRLEAVLRQAPPTPVAVLSIDLDHFKRVNDALGHLAGDAAIKTVARRLADAVGSGGMVARLAGDEFVVMQTGAEQPQGARSLAERIIEAVSAPCSFDGKRIVIGASIG